MTFPREAISDLGSVETITHLIKIPYSRALSLNIKGYRAAIADDPSGPWTTVAEGQVTDWGGADYPIELPEPATRRYVKFTARSNFGSTSQTRWSEIVAGRLLPEAEGGGPQPPATPAAARSLRPLLPVRFGGGRPITLAASAARPVRVE